MHREFGHQLPPLRPVGGRRDDAAVGEDGLVRVARQRRWHEGQLHDGAQAKTEHLVVDRVDPGEVELQGAGCIPAHDCVVVVQDRVRPHHRRAEIGACEAERFGELGGDLAAWPGPVRTQLGQPLRADHPPHPGELAGHGRRIHANQDGSCRTGGGTSRDRVGPGADSLLGLGYRPDPVPVFGVVGEPGIREWGRDHRGHVAATVPDDLRQPAVFAGSLDDVPSRTRHRIPAEPDVADR